MSLTKIARFVVVPVALATALAGTALASPQTHHCKMPDGSMDMAKTHKQCTAAKGTWAKDAPAGAGSGSASAPTTKPTPTPAPKTAPAPTPAPSPAPSK